MMFKELEARFATNWSQKLSQPFSCIAVDSIFKYSGLSLAVAGEDGKVYVYQISTFDATKSPSITSNAGGGGPLKLLSEHETKGDALQAMVVHDVTKVHANDLITCDSRGLLTVFCNGQILSRLSLSNESLDCLRVSQEPDGSVTIVAGGDAGLLAGIHPSKELWRLNLLQTPSFGPVGSSAVTCISSFDLPSSPSSSSSSSSSSLSTYVFVADNALRLHVLHGGKIVLALQTPSVIRSMTGGNFLAFEDARSSTSGFHGAQLNVDGKGTPTQIALGCENGAIYLMENFEIIRQPYAKVDHSVQHLLTIPVSNGSTIGAGSSLGGGSNVVGNHAVNDGNGVVKRRRSSSSGASHHHSHSASFSGASPSSTSLRHHDALIVAGNWNRIMLYHAGKLVASTPTKDWVCSLAPVRQPSKERTCGLVVGCLDQSVSYLEISLS